MRLKAEMEEREAWTKRERDKGAAEQKTALERVALQNKIALEQATRQAAQTIQEMEKRMNDEKRHLREVHKLELESMQAKNVELAEMQEKQHAHSLAVYELHTQNANSIREVLAALEQNISRVSAAPAQPLESCAALSSPHQTLPRLVMDLVFSAYMNRPPNITPSPNNTQGSTSGHTAGLKSSDPSRLSVETEMMGPVPQQYGPTALVLAFPEVQYHF